MKVAIPLAKNVLASLGITAAGSAIDERIQKNKTKQKQTNKKKKTWFWKNNFKRIFQQFQMKK